MLNTLTCSVSSGHEALRDECAVGRRYLHLLHELSPMMKTCNVQVMDEVDTGIPLTTFVHEDHCS